ncbi:MAG: methylmalonyl Co-A mutase-associated GTPase MeaB, partial [bacterium]|nr:methylmalonyl Co-A mutase-associated GTPase MeaB [bacterium]
RAPVVLTTANRGEGIEELWAEIERHTAHLRESDELLRRRGRRHRDEVVNRIELGLRGRARQIIESRSGAAALGRVDRREISPGAAADMLLNSLTGGAGPES